MNQAIGAALPLALGVAISPIPIIAAILMLLSDRARATGPGFLVGWVGGILLAVSLFSALSSLVPEGGQGGVSPIAGAVQIVLGVALTLMAARQWRGRPRAGEEPALPGWMNAISSFSFAKALGLGVLLSALNPKNLLLGAGAGVAIGIATGSVGTAAVAILAYAAVASSTVAVPILGFLVASQRLKDPLDRLRAWLAANNATIMSVLLLVLGVVLIGKGIAQF